MVASVLWRLKLKKQLNWMFTQHGQDHLTSLYIGQYKNLRDFSLSFDGSSFIDVFVGKNGTGKSNLFEALIEIFRHIHHLGHADNNIGFDYKVVYEIG